MNCIAAFAAMAMAWHCIAAIAIAWFPEAAAYPGAWLRVLRFYFSYAFHFNRIHPDLPSGRLYSTIDASQKPMKLVLGGTFKHEFNEAYDRLKKDMANTFAEPNFESIMVGCFIVRAIQCVVVWTISWQVGLLVGILQFVVAPLSLTGSFIRLLTNFSDALFHYMMNFMVACFVARCLPLLFGDLHLPRLTINAYFVAIFFAIDFVANLFVYFYTAESWGCGRLLKHIVYGSFNTKTYFVVVLGCLYMLEFDLLVIFGTSLLTYWSDKFAVKQKLLDFVGWPCFPICFYVEHRIGHMPVVYQHAHKMHHYLHDTTAFDAHIYGSGLNEEFFWILAEVLPCLAMPGIMFPYFLSGVTLYASWTNKGGHTRTEQGVETGTFGSFDEDNWHADHHTFHRNNFGSALGILLDFYFGTQAPGCKGGLGLSYELFPDPADSKNVVVQISVDNGYLGAPRPDESNVQEAILDLESKKMEMPLAQAQARSFTLEEIAKKRSIEAGGIWVSLHGAVFDLSSFHRIHPGGAQILLSYAGADATITFDEIGHSEKAKEMAKKRMVGFVQGQAPSGFVADMLICAEKQPAPCQSNMCLQAPLLGGS